MARLHYLLNRYAHNNIKCEILALLSKEKDSKAKCKGHRLRYKDEYDFKG